MKKNEEKFRHAVCFLAQTLVVCCSSSPHHPSSSSLIRSAAATQAHAHDYPLSAVQESQVRYQQDPEPENCSATPLLCTRDLAEAARGGPPARQPLLLTHLAHHFFADLPETFEHTTHTGSGPLYRDVYSPLTSSPSLNGGMSFLYTLHSLLSLHIHRSRLRKIVVSVESRQQEPREVAQRNHHASTSHPARGSFASLRQLPLALPRVLSCYSSDVQHSPSTGIPSYTLQLVTLNVDIDCEYIHRLDA